jgi:hypothetical protein
MREHGHHRLALGLFAAGFRHIRLAGIKLSMILDNLVTKRHDCFVTTGLFFPMALKGILAS